MSDCLFVVLPLKANETNLSYTSINGSCYLIRTKSSRNMQFLCHFNNSLRRLLQHPSRHRDQRDLRRGARGHPAVHLCRTSLFLLNRIYSLFNKGKDKYGIVFYPVIFLKYRLRTRGEIHKTF